VEIASPGLDRPAAGMPADPSETDATQKAIATPMC
jgi:hypothetical protein